MRCRDPLKDRPFKVWGYPATPIVAVAASVSMGIFVTLTDTHNALVTLGILAAGTVAYAVQLAACRR